MEHYRYSPHDHATSNVLAWSATNSANVEPSVEEDAGADADEPPDCRASSMSPIAKHFRRTPVRRGSEHQESLLTKAFQSHSEEESHGTESLLRRRRRSITSNFSIASTADLTCDTGLTTPARTSSPSPRFSTMGFVPMATTAMVVKTSVPIGGEKDAVQLLQKKRCISFACAATPKTDDKVAMLPPPPPKSVVDGAKPEAAPKKTTIKFACPAQPPRATNAIKFESRPMTPVPTASKDLRKSRSPSTVRAPRSTTTRTLFSDQAIAKTKNWLNVNASDLQSECARFYEFASEEPQEDDWVRRDGETHRPKLTIQDTLQKENAIRKLGKEAEEEADLEDPLDEEVNDEEDEEEDGEDNEDDVEDDTPEEGGLDDESNDEAEEDGVDDDVETEYNWDDEASDGYKTDNEVGFAESDDEDDDLVLWTTRVGHHTLSGAPLMRRSSIAEHSDSSACEQTRVSRKRRSKSRPLPIRAHTPELPDSTDFVCGTLDEDRPLEDAYISCVEARKRGKLLPIPQDIDPSFPTSEPEDEVEEAYAKAYGDSDEHGWLHGEFEDLHHERDRRGRKKGSSPLKRLRSPPPKRRLSPTPKNRGRSPHKPSDRQSPRRMRSPAPPCMAYRSSAATSPGDVSEHVPFKALAFRPGLTHTKSLPRAPGMFPQLKTRKSKANSTYKETTHVRGAIDIVKGLEQKRQRRKEKFYQKYCSRARKEKTHPKRPPPGQGAERMRELGLIMAGKVGPGHYVLSI